MTESLDAGEDTLPAEEKTVGVVSPAGIGAGAQLAALHERINLGRGSVRLSRFELQRLLGRGAQGSVFLAEDTELRRAVAVKVLSAGSTEDQTHARLLREARALARLKHPNVLTVHDVGVDGELIFIAMEHVETGTLATWCQENPPGSPARFRRLLELSIGIAHGVAAAHEAGIVHRDIKPANVLIGSDGRPRVADFGVARSAGRPPTFDEDTATEGAAREGPSLTRTDGVAGTPAYMAPEQWEGTAGEASDQWGLCVTLWEAAYGSPPFEWDSVPSLVAALQHAPQPPPAERGEVPGWWRTALLRGLQRDPEARWPSVGALAGELQRRRGSRSPTATRVALALAGVGIVTAGVLGQRELTRRAERRECDRLAAEVDDTWPERNTALHTGLAGTGLPYAESTAERLATMLDGWATSWRAARRDTCVRHSIDETLDEAAAARASTCLVMQRAHIDAVLDPLVASDTRLVERAVQRVASVPDPAHCLDPSRNDRLAWPDDERWERVLDVRRRSVGLLDALEAGDETAIDRARALLEDAVAIGFEPLVAEARFNIGQLLVPSAPAEAEVELRAAYFEALRLDLPPIAAQAALQLERAIVSTLARRGEAHEWTHHAQMWIDRLGESDGLLGARLAVSRGQTYGELGDYAEALRQTELALQIRERVLGPEHPMVARSVYATAQILDRQGDYETAASRLERALEIRRAALGDEHPTVTSTWAAVASVRRHQRRYEEALPIARDVLRRREALYGAGHLRTAGSLNNLGNLYNDLERYDDSLALLERALKIWSGAYGDDHPKVAMVLRNLAGTYSDAGRATEAKSVAERALRATEAVEGSDHPDVATASLNLGVALRRLGEYEAAVPSLTRALTIRETEFGPSSKLLVPPLEQLALVKAELGQPETAAQLRLRAASISTKGAGPANSR